MIVGLLSVNDHFAVHASELLLYVLSRVDISMHKTCASTVQTPDITLYHISLNDNGEHKEFVANMLSEPA